MDERGNGSFPHSRGKNCYSVSSVPAVGTSHLQIPGVPVDTQCMFAVNICVLRIERATCHPAGV